MPSPLYFKNFFLNKIYRIISVSGVTSASYVYDALGRRVKKTVGATSQEFLYDLSGRAVTMLDGSSGAWDRGEIFAGSMHLATYSGDVTTFPHANWLGTERVRSRQDGSIAEDCSYKPYGEREGCAVPDYAHSPHEYAGYERDDETGLDHMWFRYYHPRLGRFMSADPLSGSIGNPQSLNKFAYVLGNPVNATDPLGLCYFPVYIIGFDHDGRSITSTMCLDNMIGWAPMYYLSGNFCAAIGGCAPSPNSGGSGGGSGGQTPAPAPAQNDSSFCSNNAGRNAVREVNTADGAIRYSFDQAGQLSGMSVLLTPRHNVGNPGQSVQRGNFSIPEGTWLGYSRTGEGSVQFGVSNPVLIDRPGPLNAYFSTASFSNGQYAEVAGSIAVGGLPLGNPETRSGPLTSFFNENMAHFGQSVASMANILHSVFKCEDIF